MSILIHQGLPALESFNKSFFLFNWCFANYFFNFSFNCINLSFGWIRLFYIHKIKIRVTIWIIILMFISEIILLIILIKSINVIFLNFFNRDPLIGLIAWIRKFYARSLRNLLWSFSILSYFLIRWWNHFVIVFYYFNWSISLIFHLCYV